MASRRWSYKAGAFRNSRSRLILRDCLRRAVTVTDILDAIRRTNLIDSPGLIESDHHLVLGLVSGQVHTRGRNWTDRREDVRGGVPIRIGDIATVAASVAPVYTIVTANGKPAVLLNVNRQPDSNTLAGGK